MSQSSRIVHVHPSTVLLDNLAAAGIEGDRLEWCDPVCSGPTPAGLSDDEWYRVRAAHLSGGPGAPDASACQARLRAQDDALSSVAADSQIVLWVGPELFCQSVLMRILQKLAADAREAPMLVDPGDDPRYPGCSLGHLTAAEL